MGCTVGDMNGPRLADLRTIPLFRQFTDSDLAGLAESFKRTTPRSDGALFDVGEPATSLYVLTAGEVLLNVPGDDTFHLRPPALIGELGGIAGLPRNGRAVASADAEVWEIGQETLQRLFAQRQELGVRFLSNLVDMVAHKVQRDQRRLADMRANLVLTQKSLKSLRQVVLEAKETPISAKVHDTLDQLIVHNRRVNYRVEPPPALASFVRVDGGDAQIIELSRTHITMQWPEGQNNVPAVGDWSSGIACLAGSEIAISGKIMRSAKRTVTVELDLLIDASVAVFEGYLTRVQLLDILV
jgi:CRP/FNR family transcriptional regulator, cyclic AMP receptor protein